MRKQFGFAMAGMMMAILSFSLPVEAVSVTWTFDEDNGTDLTGAVPTGTDTTPRFDRNIANSFTDGTGAYEVKRDSGNLLNFAVADLGTSGIASGQAFLEATISGFNLQGSRSEEIHFGVLNSFDPSTETASVLAQIELLRTDHPTNGNLSLLQVQGVVFDNGEMLFPADPVTIRVLDESGGAGILSEPLHLALNMDLDRDLVQFAYRFDSSPSYSVFAEANALAPSKEANLIRLRTFGNYAGGGGTEFVDIDTIGFNDTGEFFVPEPATWLTLSGGLLLLLLSLRRRRVLKATC